MKSLYSDSSLKNILHKCVENIEDSNYKGFDPWDGLNTAEFPKIYRSRITKLLFLHFHSHSPINFRKSFGVRPTVNFKGLGLMIETYINLFKLTNKVSYLDKAEKLATVIIRGRNKKFPGISWGYPYPWETRYRTLERYDSNVVTTYFCMRALFALNKIRPIPSFDLIVNLSSSFVLKSLWRSSDDSGICFSYTPFDKFQILNASLMAAEILSYSYQLNSNYKAKELAIEALNFVIDKQHSDGSWNYTLSHKTGLNIEESGKSQIDWHQGFVIDSIINLIELLELDFRTFGSSIDKGVEFYREEQFNNGKSKWRWPRQWPIDIHNQSQGIITLSNSKIKSVQNDKVSEEILFWTLKNMYNSKAGFFYYRIWPFMTIRISYIRYSQMWMSKALSSYLLSKTH